MENISNLQKKLSQCKKEGGGKVEILNQLSKAYWNLSPHKAMDYGKQALELSKKINDKEGKGKAFNTIGVSYYYLARYDSALECFFKSLKIHEELGIKRKIASSYNNIGMIYEVTDKYKDALEFYNNSLKIEKELGNKRVIANSLNNTGNVWGHLKKPDKVLEHYKKALKIFEEIDDKLGVSASLNNIGDVYLTVIENPDKALEYFLKSLKINKEIGNKNRIAISLINLGDCYTKLHNPQKALIYLKLGLEVAEDIEAKNIISGCYKIYSELYSIKENYKKALEYHKLYSEIENSIFTEEGNQKIAEMQTKYETEKKEKEAEIFRLKNVELAKANKQLKKEITKRKKAEEEIKISKERLQIINKILRHDLTNNFVVIISAINLYKINSETKMLSEIEKRAAKSLNTIRRLREQESFIDSHSELNEYNITEVLNNIIVDFPDVDIHIEGSCTAFADEALYSVFENLINNAVKHGNSKKIEVSITSDKQFCEIKFKDFGTGIPDEIKDKIFDEGFYHGKTGHTGIGLHIVKRTIESYGGSVSVEDNEPNGAVFVMKLRKVIT